jgi:predicted ATPase
MKYLFVDNYRGFSDTLIPLRQVTFLVGENSTGKTSILSIMRLLSDYKFWYEQQFNDKDVQLGNFRDIISVASANSSTFSIGMIDTSPENTESSIAFLAVFSEREGLPTISKFHYCYGKIETNIYLTGPNVRYNVSKISDFKTDVGFLQSLIRKWNTQKKERKGLKEFKPPKYATAIMYVLQSVDQISREGGLPFRFIIQNSFMSITWLAPIRSKPKRTYDDYKTDFSSDGSHTPYLVRKILGTSSSSSKFKDFIREFGTNSGLMDSVGIRKYGEDEIISPFELSIELEKKNLNIKYVGYGVSQVLPVVVEIYNGEKQDWFVIQQPEVHLHPKAQAALGDLIHMMAKKEKKNFLIETHSDYMIDRFRRNYLGSKGAVDAQVLFFRRKGLENEVDSVRIRDSGEYDTNQPKEFREFFIKEELDNLGIK